MANTNTTVPEGKKNSSGYVLLLIFAVILYGTASFIGWQIANIQVNANILGCHTVTGWINVIGRLPGGVLTQEEIKSCQQLAESSSQQIHGVDVGIACIVASMIFVIFVFVLPKIFGSKKKSSTVNTNA